MNFLDNLCDELREQYKIEINIQDKLYNITNEKEIIAYFDLLLSGNFQYFNNLNQIISLAHQLIFATLYRPNNTKLYSEIINLINTKICENETIFTENNKFSAIIFNTITKYLLSIKIFPSISPLIFLLRRVFEKNLISIDQIVTFLHSIQSNNDNKEIILLSFVVFAPEIEKYDIDSYDSFYNVVEDLSFAQTSDDEYQISDEGYNYHPYRSFITRFIEFENKNDESDEESADNDQTDKWSKLKKCVYDECDSLFPYLMAIKNDDVDNLQTIITTTPEFDINQRVPKTVFEPNPNANSDYCLIEYCALFGSIKCFKFLLLQQARLPFMVHKSAIIGGNVEIIHIIEQQQQNKPNDESHQNEEEQESEAKSEAESEVPKNIGYCKFFPEGLHCAALYHRNSVFYWLYETKGCNLFEFDFEGKTVIGCAAASNNIEILVYIIQTGIVKINFADLSYDNFIEKTPLIYACEKGCYEACKILLDQKSIQINFENYSPIHAALSNFHFHIIRLLCERKDIDLNVTDENGSTPLHLAIMNEDIETVKMLLSIQNNIDINRKNKIKKKKINWVSF